ncbi:MAG: hypothetical protein N3A69_07090, partial [Leptospiraceae bacterium]|nr:hypothetical protein [Leptospiraceae bacterium]
MGDFEKYNKAIQDAYNLAVEFEYEKEFVLIQLIRAEVEFLSARKNRDFTRVLEKIETIENKLKNSIGLLYELEENVLNYIYTLKSYSYVHLKNKEALRQTRESLFSIIFFRQLLTNEFRFQNVEMFRNLNRLQFLVSEDREYSLKIEFALEKEQDPKEILKAKDKNYKEILDSIAEFKKRFPKGSDAFSWMQAPKFKKPELSSEELIVEIYNSQTELFIITNFQNKEEIFNIHYNKENLTKLLSETLQKSILKNSNVRRIVFIPSIYLYNVSFQNLAFDNKT